jgi:hypothetical protein
VAISLMGLGLGVALGTMAGGWVASRMTRTPANKRILYSGVVQMVAGWFLRKKWPSVAIGMIASGAVNVVSVAFAASPTALLDGQRFVTTNLPAAESNSLRETSATLSVDSTT